MSRQQLMNLYQRQVALGGAQVGGMSTGGDGGLFTAASRQGLAEYRAWHAEYKMAHPDASRDEFKAAWRMHKMALGEAPPKGSMLLGGRRKPKGLVHCAMEKRGPSGLRRCAQMAEGPAGSALVGGYSDMTPMRGMALVGGARMSKGVRHCMEEALGPSGLRRCKKFMAGPRSAMHSGSALVGGFPGQKKLFEAWRRQNNCSDAAVKAAFARARDAYEDGLGPNADFRAGVEAARASLGLPPSAIDVKKLRAPRARARRAAAPMEAAQMAAVEMAPAPSLADVYPEEPQPALSDEEMRQLLGLEPAMGQGARRRRL